MHLNERIGVVYVTTVITKQILIVAFYIEVFPHNLCQIYLVWSKSIQTYKYLIKLVILL